MKAVSPSSRAAQLLHSLMYSRRAKKLDVKPNILAFSGFSFVGGEDEEAEFAKVHAKASKWKLAEIKDVMDMLEVRWGGVHTPHARTHTRARTRSDRPLVQDGRRDQGGAC